MLTTNFSQNLHGYLCSIEGGVGKLESQLDSIGRTMWTRTPDAGKTVYTYNTNGLVDSITELGKNEGDSISRVTYYQYNSDNEVKFVDHDGTVEDISYEYYSIVSSPDRFNY